MIGARSRHTAGAPLVIDHYARARINAIVRLAQAEPIDVTQVAAMIETAHGEALHRKRMMMRSVTLTGGYTVTFSWETGHPAGLCRHISIASREPGRVPALNITTALLRMFGFAGGFDGCVTWCEPLQDGNHAVNLVQPVPA